MGALLENHEEGTYARGLCVEEGSGTGVYPYKGPIGEPGERGGLSTGNFERAQGGLWLSLSLSKGALFGEPGEGGAPLLGAI
jgi:hypothetical protein